MDIREMLGTHGGGLFAARPLQHRQLSRFALHLTFQIHAGLFTPSQGLPSLFNLAGAGLTRLAGLPGLAGLGLRGLRDLRDLGLAGLAGLPLAGPAGLAKLAGLAGLGFWGFWGLLA